MTSASILPRLKDSLAASAGTIVFGMEDGTVSIFGLVFGVAATTTSTVAVLVAGASGAAAAAVSMMAGAYLEAETSRDAQKASQESRAAELALSHSASLSLCTERLTASGLTETQCTALQAAVQTNPDAVKALVLALRGTPDETLNPMEQALWMLLADFFSAAIPIVPFMLLPIGTARYVSAGITILLLAALGIGRARIGNRNIPRTVAETVAMGIAAALAGVGIGMLFNRSFGG